MTRNRPSPLQNRVLATGAIVADPARGLMMGNRGGRLHDEAFRIAKAQASRRWICCTLEWRHRQRTVMGQGYTELFFLDEVVALSAGHRPCHECRRMAALSFRAALEGERGGPWLADTIDRQLATERLRPHVAPASSLPDGAVILIDETPHALRDCRALPIHADGYERPRPRPKRGQVQVLSAPLMLAALRGGYRPVWHSSALP